MAEVLKRLKKIKLEGILPPVARKLWTYFIISYYKKLENYLDIESAFLQGHHISCDIFVRPPKEVNTTNLWKLLVTAYGLCDAPRAWYQNVKEVIEASGAIKSKFDTIIYWLCKGNL